MEVTKKKTALFRRISDILIVENVEFTDYFFPCSNPKVQIRSKKFY